MWFLECFGNIIVSGYEKYKIIVHKKKKTLVNVGFLRKKNAENCEFVKRTLQFHKNNNSNVYFKRLLFCCWCLVHCALHKFSYVHVHLGFNHKDLRWIHIWAMITSLAWNLRVCFGLVTLPVRQQLSVKKTKASLCQRDDKINISYTDVCCWRRANMEIIELTLEKAELCWTLCWTIVLCILLKWLCAQ